VAVRLRKVAQQLPTRRIGFFGHQPHVVGAAGGALEDLACPVGVPGQSDGLRQPEGAEQEGALLARQAVVAGRTSEIRYGSPSEAASPGSRKTG
jgi:hypothetical protein